MAVNFGTGKPLTAYAIDPTPRHTVAAVEAGDDRAAQVKAHPQDTTAPGYDPRVAMLQCALAWEPEARLIGNVTALDVAKVAALTMTQCPACGSEAWVNIDCGVCCTVWKLVRDVPEYVKKEGKNG